MLTMKVNGTEMLVTGGPNGTLGIFDLTVLKQVGEAHGHTAPVREHIPLYSVNIMRLRMTEDGGWLQVATLLAGPPDSNVFFSASADGCAPSDQSR